MAMPRTAPSLHHLQCLFSSGLQTLLGSDCRSGNITDSIFCPVPLCDTICVAPGFNLKNFVANTLYLGLSDIALATMAMRFWKRFLITDSSRSRRFSPVGSKATTVWPMAAASREYVPMFAPTTSWIVLGYRVSSDLKLGRYCPSHVPDFTSDFDITVSWTMLWIQIL